MYYVGTMALVDIEREFTLIMLNDYLEPESKLTNLTFDIKK